MQLQSIFARFALSRLWVCNKTPADNPDSQQISYTNLVPKKAVHADYSTGCFQGFRETIERFNEMIAQQPLQGEYLFHGGMMYENASLY